MYKPGLNVFSTFPLLGLLLSPSFCANWDRGGSWQKQITRGNQRRQTRALKIDTCHKVALRSLWFSYSSSFCQMYIKTSKQKIISFLLVLIRRLEFALPDKNQNTSQIQKSILSHWNSGTNEHTWCILQTALIRTHMINFENTSEWTKHTPEN